MFELSDQQRDEYMQRCILRWSPDKWYQYRLSTLLLVTAGFAVILGAMRIACNQRNQIALVSELGGIPYTKTSADWFDLLSSRSGAVYVANFSQTNLTDNDLLLLQSFPFLETLILRNTAITDRGFQHLSRFRSLRRVDVTGTAVSRPAITELTAARPEIAVGPITWKTEISW